MSTQKMLAPFRRAINDYKMISDGDSIGVGVSGGKDSMTLLALLRAYQIFSPEKFTLKAFTIDLGFGNMDFSPIKDYCDANDIEYEIEKSNIGEVIFEKTPENPCSLCSKMRRGALNGLLMSHGCNKLALGHHADDVLETFLLSFLYEGRLSTFAPISYMSRSKISVIRPMIYINERDIIGYAKSLPVVHNTCPADKHTKRQTMKDLIKYIQRDYPEGKDRMMSAVMNPDRYNLWNGLLERYRSEIENPQEEE